MLESPEPSFKFAFSITSIAAEPAFPIAFAPEAYHALTDPLLYEAVIKLASARSLNDPISLPGPSSNDCESGKATILKFRGTAFPDLISNSFSVAANFEEFKSSLEEVSL